MRQCAIMLIYQKCSVVNLMMIKNKHVGAHIVFDLLQNMFMLANTLISFYNDIYNDIETQIFFQNNDIEVQLFFKITI